MTQLPPPRIITQEEFFDAFLTNLIRDKRPYALQIKAMGDVELASEMVKRCHEDDMKRTDDTYIQVQLVRAEARRRRTELEVLLKDSPIRKSPFDHTDYKRLSLYEYLLARPTLEGGNASKALRTANLETRIFTERDFEDNFAEIRTGYYKYRSKQGEQNKNK